MGRSQAQSKPKLAMTAAVMDLLHAGHIKLLEEMNKRADLVLVVLHDGFSTFKNKRKLPIESLEKRTRNLIDSGLVDIVKHTFQPEPDFKPLLERYKKFDVTFYRGDDWSDFPGKKTLGRTKIVLLPYSKGISSTMLRNEL